jgi:hypothetical protein
VGENGAATGPTTIRGKTIRSARASLLSGFEREFTVGPVPAGRIALTEHENYSAYICRPNRSFRSGMGHLGFYARGEISPTN